MGNPVETMLAEKARFVPEKGYNLVGLDDFQPAGERLYLIDHFDDRDGAQAAMAKRQTAEPDGDRMFIYGPDDQ